MSVLKSLFAAVVIGLSATISNAAIMSFPGGSPSPAAPVFEDIEAGEEYAYFFTASGTDNVLYTFTALEALTVEGASFTSNGTSASVASTSLAFDGGPITAFTPSGGSGAATGTFNFAPFTMDAGDQFTFEIFSDSTAPPALLTAYFQTSIIPVPAALPLLGGGLLLLAGLRRRAKTA